MNVYEIVNHNGDIVEYVHADNERQALCKYLMEHEELTDMMLWLAFYSNEWRLAEYDYADECLRARKTYDF